MEKESNYVFLQNWTVLVVIDDFGHNLWRTVIRPP